MSTESIGAYTYSSAYSSLRASAEEQKLKQLAAKTDQENVAATGNTAIANEIMGFLSDIPKGEDGKLSFQDVDDYRATLETEWDLAVMADLEALGIDIDQQFPLTYDPATGKVTVAKGHKDKEAVDAYFEANPDKVEEFNQILQLGKLTTVADSQLSQTELTTNLQQQSLAWWYQDNTDPTSWFDGGSLMLTQGQSSYKSLNLMV